MDFALFILLNAITLIRPEDFQPEIQGARLYLIVIVLNVAVAFPKIIQRVRLSELEKRPISVCVLGLLAATALSHLARGQMSLAYEFVPDFAKVVVYFVLLVAVIDTPARLRIFLGFLVVLISVVAALGLLQFHGVFDYEALRPVMQWEFDPETGGEIQVARLCGAGVFNDPNDLCLVLTLGIICCLFQATTSWYHGLGAIWLLPIGLFGYAMVLTKSRGGLLGLMAGLSALLIAKFGWRRALPIAIVGVPVMILAIGGRQSNIGLGDTANERIMLWAAGFTELFRSPFYVMTGIGAGEYADAMGQVAHNSYVHAYVELGLFGGTLFLMAFLLPVRMLYSLRPELKPNLSPGIAIFQPFLLAMMVGYAAGMYSLSRNYIVPTYMCIGLAETYLTMAMPHPPKRFRVTPTWAKQTALLGIGGMVFLKLFTQFAGNMAQ